MHEIDPFSLCYEQSGQGESILGQAHAQNAQLPNFTNSLT